MSWLDDWGTRRNRRILAAAGTALAVVPLAASLYAVDAHTRTQARAQVREIAEDTLAFAENAVSNGLMTLTALGMAGIERCDDRAVGLMLDAIYEQFAVKEIGITEPDGRITCSHIGKQIDVTVISRMEHDIYTGATLMLVEMGAADRLGLMLYREPPASGEPGLSVTVPSDALTTASAPRAVRETARGVLKTRDGKVAGHLASFGIPFDAPAAEDAAAVTIASTRYPIVIDLSVPMQTFRERNADLYGYAVLGGVVGGVVILGVTILILRRPRSLAARLRDAAASDAFIPHYQPVLDIRSGRLIGCEALMRWQKPDGSIVPPADFIDVAERSGLASEMTRSLMRHIRSDLDGVFGVRPHLKIGINLFDAHFDDPATVSDIRHLFGGSAIGFGQLMFELTERRPLRDTERARAIIGDLRALGCSVALDDAGTGYSGLAHLQELGIDTVKIDKMFVDVLNVNPESAPIVDSLINLGHDLGMQVIAEGVETQEQLDYLHRRGADAAQGFLFSPPLPRAAFLSLVEAVSPLPQPTVVGRLELRQAG